MSSTTEKAAGSAVPFTISQIGVGLNNLDHHNQRALVDACVDAGPWRFRAYLHADGKVVLPSSLRDEHLRLAIADELRRQALDRIAGSWARVQQLERERAARGRTA